MADTKIDLGDHQDDESTIGSISNNVTKKVGEAIAANVVKEGTARAKTLFDSYARVDFLQPFFDLEPSDVRNRLLESMIPRIRKDQDVPKDLYGPTMLTFSLAAVLLIIMKNSETERSFNAQGTVMGAAFGIAFGYWMTITGVLYAIAFIFNTTITLMELTTATGYALFSYCIVLLSTYLHPQDHWFFITWISVGTLSAARLGLLLRSRTSDSKQGIILGGLAFAIHWLYLWYLHVAYCNLDHE